MQEAKPGIYSLTFSQGRPQADRLTWQQHEWRNPHILEQIAYHRPFQFIHRETSQEEQQVASRKVCSPCKLEQLPFVDRPDEASNRFFLSRKASHLLACKANSTEYDLKLS